MKRTLLYLILLATLQACQNPSTTAANNQTASANEVDQSSIDQNDYVLEAKAVVAPPQIDGSASDASWSSVSWYPIQYTWLGGIYSSEDFSGRFKLTYDSTKLYVLVEIVDDVLVDHSAKWDTLWWNDDCVEIFIDEDNGDDLHQFNHKAFAYHVALNGKDVVDLGPDQKPHLYNDHLTAARITTGNTSVWEFAIDIYDDTFVDGQNNTPVALHKGKTLGFTLNYCDSDTTMLRENFISSIPVTGDDKDLGWKDASVFNDLILN
jgi:hypothetical protein